jgi:putative phosphoribosyl transferase
MPHWRPFARVGVRRLIAAVPVPPRVPSELRSQVDEVVILEAPALFFGIGQFYADFSQVSDEEVIECLKESRAVTAIRDLADDQRSRTPQGGVSMRTLLAVDGSDQSYDAVRALSQMTRSAP